MALLLVALPVWGQESEAEVQPATEAPAPVAIPEVAANSESLRADLRETMGRLAKIPQVAAIEEHLPEVRSLVDQRAAEIVVLLEGAPTLEQLVDAERAWSSRSRELAVWREALAKRASSVETELATLESHRKLWETTRERARESGAPPDVLDTIDANLEAVATTRKLANRTRADLLSVLNSVAQEELAVSESQSAIASARAMIRAQILEPDSAPLWLSATRPAGASSLAERVRTSVEADKDIVVAFVAERRRAFVPVLLSFGAALALALFVRVRLRRRDPSGALAGSVAAFERPYSIATIGAFLAAIVAFPYAPTVATRVAGTFLVVPVLRVLAPLGHDAFRPILYVLTGFYLVDRVRDFLDSIVVLERGIFFLETVGGVAFLVWLFRPSRLKRFPADGHRPPSGIRAALRLAVAVLAASALANLLGYVTFAKVLGEGTLQTAYLSVLFYAAFRVGMTTLLVVFSSAKARRWHVIESQGEKLFGWARLLLTLGLGVLWLKNVLESFAVRTQAEKMAGLLLTSDVTLGTVSFSLGDVLGFLLTVAVSFLLAGLIRVLLNEDMLPKLSLGRGMANAISTTAQYAVLLVGFLLALGAAGIDLSRFALLAGALGVGIGFGLQNVVNNFVSGLILLFERPIQVGDTIELGGLLGDVKHIGIRASIVRTFKGADVLVPNGNLISSEVINWTLNDRHRRVEIPVGVAYGNRPARVIEVLDAVVSSDSRVLREPPPVTLFRGFGESSLDFEVRFWAPDYRTFLALSSDIACAIYDALLEKGIEIPFPQRDLHLKSVSGSVASHLREGKETTE